MRDVIIVGGGLFGSIAAMALRGAGMDVCLIDDQRARSGSRAAGCLMKTGWLSKMGSANVDKSFQLLDRLYGLTTIKLHAGMLPVTAEWINPDKVLASSRQLKRVSAVSHVAPGHNRVRFAPDLEHLDAKTVIVACGSWTRDLVYGAPIVGKTGVSVRLKQPPLDNRISVWAPYKQLVRFSQDDFRWAGDGTAILDRNWTIGREIESLNRIIDFAGDGKSRAVGIRPFAQTSDPAALEEVAPGLWSLTGGGKNGTAAAGWAAVRLLEALT